MGQAMEVVASRQGDVVIFDTDRSITGQDGISYTSVGEAAIDSRFPGRLAERLMTADPSLSSVWLASNLVVARRAAAWEPAAIDATAAIIRDFFLFYPEVAAPS